MFFERIVCLKSLILRRKAKLFTAIFCTSLVLLHWILLKFSNTEIPSHCQEPIDVVYTWVNGSDPDFIESALKWSRGMDYHPKRYDDKNELKYSLRSIERFAPWVRHVYIVANQIPHWLDLNHERVSVVPHEHISPNPEFLPTFSSPAIETFLHRIPNLSTRFLYLNDDFFLGVPLYPEDLYTESEGVKIYQMRQLPDCVKDCPWAYVGDGACDSQCNISDCQFDGGDCSTANSQNRDDAKVKRSTLSKMNPFPLRNPTWRHKNVAQLKELMMQQNFSTLSELESVLEAFEKQQNVPKPHKYIEPKRNNPSKNSSLEEEVRSIYTSSVFYTNMLLNRHYGFKTRNWIAHVGCLFDRYIINEMQAKFPEDVLRTASNRFRAVDDLQFQFAYYYFLMSETVTLSVEEIFDEFDTDTSGSWSDREVRVFLTRMFPVVDEKAMHSFEEVIRNCSEERDEFQNVVVTREFVSKCPILAEAMRINFGTRSKYKYKINPIRNDHSRYMGLRSNASEMTQEFDRIRRFPRKFICINDDLDPAKADDNAIVRDLLEDFYMSFFPRRSQFELPEGARNPFSSWQEYENWRQRRYVALGLEYCVIFFLIVVCVFLSFRIL